MADTPENRAPAPVLTGGTPADIHLGYLRRDVDEMKRTITSSFEDITKTLKDIRDGHPTRVEFTELANLVAGKLDLSAFADHLKADEDHEIRIRVLEKALWKYVGASAVIGGAISMLGSFLLSKL